MTLLDEFSLVKLCIDLKVIELHTTILEVLENCTIYRCSDCLKFKVAVYITSDSYACLPICQHH